MQVGIIGNQFFYLGIGFINILRVSRKGNPAERTDPFAKKWTNIGGDESGEIKSVIDPFFKGDLADIVAVIKGCGSLLLHLQHCYDMLGHRSLGRINHFLRFFLSQASGLLHGPALGKVTVEGVMGAGLIGTDIGGDFSAHQFWHDFGTVAKQADGDSLFVVTGFFYQL